MVDFLHSHSEIVSFSVHEASKWLSSEPSISIMLTVPSKAFLSPKPKNFEKLLDSNEINEKSLKVFAVSRDFLYEIWHLFFISPTTINVKLHTNSIQSLEDFGIHHGLMITRSEEFGRVNNFWNFVFVFSPSFTNIYFRLPLPFLVLRWYSL